MNFDLTIRMLQTLKQPAEPAEWKRKAERAAWAQRLCEQWYQAMLEMDRKCMAAVDKLSEEEFDRLFEEEQAKVDALRAIIDDVIENDRWPKDLHWTV